MYRFENVIFHSSYKTELLLHPATLIAKPKLPASHIHSTINRWAFNKSKKYKLVPGLVYNHNYAVSEASLCPTTPIECDFKWLGFSISPSTRSWQICWH